MKPTQNKTLEQLLGTMTITPIIEKDYVSDVALKILLQNLTPVRVANSFEKIVFNRLGLEFSQNIYRFATAGIVLAVIAIGSFASFSTVVNSELALVSTKNTEQYSPAEFIITPEKSTVIAPVTVEKTSVNESIEKDDSKIAKKKTFRKSTVDNNITTETKTPPKGIE